MDVFLVRELQPGLANDASKFSHPMEVHHFPSNNMILDYFSSVAYNKVNCYFYCLALLMYRKILSVL